MCQTGQERIPKRLTYTPERNLLSSLKSGQHVAANRQAWASLCFSIQATHAQTRRDALTVITGWKQAQKKGITAGRTGWNKEKLQNIGVQVREMAGEGKVGRVKTRKRAEVYVWGKKKKKKGKMSGVEEGGGEHMW